MKHQPTNFNNDWDDKNRDKDCESEVKYQGTLYLFSHYTQSTTVLNSSNACYVGESDVPD